MGAGTGGPKLDFTDDADEEMLDVDDAGFDDEVNDQLPDEDETEAAEEIACIPLNGQLARPSVVWQQVKAQLRYQTDHGTYDIWIANTDGIGVEDAPEAVGTSQTLVVQVLSQNAADWLEMRLKPLVLRTLQGLVGSFIRRAVPDRLTRRSAVSQRESLQPP